MQVPFALSPARAQSARASSVPSLQSDEALRSWLIEHLERSDPSGDDDEESEDATTKFAHARVRLVDSAPPMDLVFLTGHVWCGSGGCTTLVIDRSSGTPRIVSNISVTQPPISVLPTTNKGWHDIRALGAGGGRPAAEWETYRFTGEDYTEYRSGPWHAGEKAGQMVFTDATPLHFLYRCRRRTVGEDMRDCKVPKFTPPKR
jgi:hypothetical protein